MQTDDDSDISKDEERAEAAAQDVHGIAQKVAKRIQQMEVPRARSPRGLRPWSFA